MSRWEDAIWVGVAKKSNEHVVVREGGDQQLGVRLSSGGRSQADGVPKRLHCGNRARRHRREDLLRQRERDPHSDEWCGRRNAAANDAGTSKTRKA